MAPTDLITKLFDHQFASRWTGACTGWTKELAMCHMVADGIIWLAYMTIPVLLIRIVRTRKDLPFNTLFFLFAAFIIGCGLTHMMGTIVTFRPYYYLDFWVKALTAVASIGTAFVLWKAYPKIIALPSVFTAAMIEKTNKELEQINKDLEMFALIAAHDLQDPLKQNNVFIRMIKNGRPEFLDDMEKNNTRMNDFIKNLLVFARSGGTNLTIKRVALNDLLKGVQTDLQALIRDTQTQVVVGDLPTINCDPVQMGRVFHNLIKNSIRGRAADRPMRIEVRATRKEDRWLFSVQDNGVGITPENMATLFTIYRGKKNDNTGAGFGLAICKRIVESHHGVIKAESSVGVGTEVSFII